LALAGMDNILRKSKKIKMLIEFFPLLIEKMGNSPQEFIHQLLEDYRFSIYIIPEDYDAPTSLIQNINNVKEIMGLFKTREDHINLFLEK